MTKTKGKTKGKLGVASPDLNIPVGDRTVVIDGRAYVAENVEKWDRAVNGTIIDQGGLIGGVGKDASPEAKLVAYDKLGGYITFEGRKVKTGAFWSFDDNAAVESPEPVLLFRVDGENVEVPVGAQLPIEVQASELAGKKKAGKVVSKAKAKPSIEDEE